MTGIPYDDFGARQYDPFTASWLAPDPLAGDYPGISPYVYCAGDPVNLVDREGKFPETLWDIANVVMDVSSLVDNVKNRKWGAVALDAGGLVLDIAAAALPFVPGGAGSAIKAAKAADKAIDAAKAVDGTVDVSKAINRADDAVDVVKKVHGNAATSSKAQHAYDIIDTKTGKVVKTGVSGGPIRKADGKSYRAESQVRKWNAEEGYEGYERYISVITHNEPQGLNARGKIYKYERTHTDELKAKGYLKNTRFHKRP